MLARSHDTHLGQGREEEGEREREKRERVVEREGGRV